MTQALAPDMPADSDCRIVLVAGTRPNLVKLGPLHAGLARQTWCTPSVLFLEQHTDRALSDEIMEDVGIDDARLFRVGLNQTDPGLRIGEMVNVSSAWLSNNHPDLVMVFGDVDATLAASIAAKRLGYPVAHVEAGLRSFDRRMPEELNRLMVDSISDMFLTTSMDASRQLLAEGHRPESVEFVGNLMIDSLVNGLDQGLGRDRLRALGLSSGEFGVATFHRPSNVDDKQSLTQVLALLAQVAQRMPLLMPLHPRTRAALERHALMDVARAIGDLRLVPAIRYQEFVSIVSLARYVLTDSGGIQEESSFLGIPCMTFRENTERPITITQGTNRLVNAADLLATTDAILQAPARRPANIPLWDGQTAGRIVEHLHDWWAAKQA